MKAGHFVVCDQLMDFTKARISTFYDNPIRGVAHADFTNPYCETLRQKAIAILKKTDITFHEKGCYVCTDGPRFETAAEVRAYAMLGGDVIGMTNAQEAALAREAELCYTNVAIVTNMGAGISPTPLSHKEVVEAMAQSIKNMEKLILGFIGYNKKVKDICLCKHCMKDFGGFKLYPEKE
jgi:5'-methylthioadenosine phosphorylase